MMLAKSTLNKGPVGPSVWIREGWRKLSKIPGGRRIFDRMLSRAIPYTGSIGARVIELRRGYCCVRLPDKRPVQNHLGSVHAIALANLGELAGNLALIYGMPDDARFIVVELRIEFKKKAHGTLTAQCHCEPPATSERREYAIEVAITNAEGEEVSRVFLKTLVGPLKS